MKEDYSKVLSKVPFLWIFLGLGLIGSVLYKISHYDLEGKKFPIEYFIWGFIFAIILALLIKFIPNISPKTSKVLSDLVAVFITILFISLCSLFLYKELKHIFKNNEIENNNDKSDNLLIENLKTEKRKISFSYNYNSSKPAAISVSLAPKEKHLPEYPSLILGKKITTGINNITIDFSSINWGYLRKNEIEIFIRLFLSEYGGKEELIEELKYFEVNGEQFIKKAD